MTCQNLQNNFFIWYLLASLKKCHSPNMASSISFCLEVIVCFVDIGRIDDHHCLEVIAYFVDIGRIDDHHCLEVIVCFVDIGRIDFTV
jgi:hypothetical protein